MRASARDKPGARSGRGGVRLWAAAAALTLALSGGCAKTGLPGGGPKDTEPPTVVSTSPAEGATAVARASAIAMEFSEEMDRTSVERAFEIDPDVALGRFEWSGPTVTASPESLLPDSTTVVVTVGEGARDYHGVAIGEDFTLAFSTGASVAAGTVSGTVTFGGNVVDDATVWACPEPVAADTAGNIEACEYETVTGEDGVFLFRNVRTRDRRYSLVAFLDGDGDNVFDSTRETGWIASYAALVDSPGDSVGGLVLELVVPPGGEGP